MLDQSDIILQNALKLNKDQVKEFNAPVDNREDENNNDDDKPTTTPPAKPAEDGNGNGAGEGQEVAAAAPGADDPAKQSPTPPAPAPQDLSDLTDEQIIELLKKKGKNITSLDEIGVEPRVLTAEEIAAQQVQKKENALKKGLETGAFSTTDLGNFNIDNAKTPREIAFGLFAAEQLDLDAAVTADEISERFSEVYGEGQVDGHWLKEQGLKRMEYIKNAYIQNKYNAITGAEQAYDHIETVQKQTVNYKNSIENIFNTLPKTLEFELPVVNPKGETENKKYTFEFTPEELADAKKNFLTEASFQALGMGEIDMAKLTSSVDVARKALSLNKIIKIIATAHADDRILAMEAERKGVMPETAIGASAADPDGKKPGLPEEAQQHMTNFYTKKR